MTPFVFAIIGVTIIFSSFLSGVFGMAGGMVLLGVLLVYFDVATAMIFFSIIQFVANGWRAVQWRQLHAVADLRLVCGRRGHLVRGDVRRSRSSPTRRWSTSCSG